MAQGAIILLLFAFMMCLSCLSSSAAGSGIFYACSDGTMSPDEFDFKKCTNFGFSDILEGTEAITGLDVGSEEEFEPSDTTSQDMGLLVPGGLSDEDDPNSTYIDFFGSGKSETLQGLGVVATASSLGECAKLCYENGVAMRGESDECNGFVSDKASKCILYPANITNTGSTLQSGEKSYSLKGSRSGLSFTTFTAKTFETIFSDKGDITAYGNDHDVECENSSGGKGALTSFKWQNTGQQVRNLYSCMMGDFGRSGSLKQTPQGQTGGFNQLTVNDVGLVDCGNQFIERWKMKQWSNQANIEFKCTSKETSDPTACVDLETSAYGGTGATTSDLTNVNVQCPSNKALTQFNWSDSKIKYRCCPKPTSTTSSRSGSRTNASRSSTGTSIDDTSVTAGGTCYKRSNMHNDSCSDSCPSHNDSGACAGPKNTWGNPCCYWEPN